MFYWTEFSNGTKGTIQAVSFVDLVERAAQYGTLIVAGVIPYPSGRQLDVVSDCPSFCCTPRECLGKGACPANRACND